jgi:hypothetical protein
MYVGWSMPAYVPIAANIDEVDKKTEENLSCSVKRNSGSSDGGIAKVVSCRSKEAVAGSGVK